MENRKNGRMGLFILTALCIALIVLSAVNGGESGPVSRTIRTIVSPFQKGLNILGSRVSGLSANLSESGTLQSENQALQEKVDQLTAENSQLVLDKEELTRLQTLLDLKDQYSDYDTVGARVISKESGNWYHSFTIDKGTDDGVQVDCNVMSGAGLVGIVTDAGPTWAKVRAIIDDDSNVSAMVSTTSDTCIVAGNLQLIDQGTMSLVKLTDDNNHVHVGDKVVTSNISEKYLPGILIGYISELSNDANNLTKSGQLTPVVDFRHIQEVLVIRTLKNYVASTSDSASDKARESEDAAAENAAEDSGQSENSSSAEADAVQQAGGEDASASGAGAGGEDASASGAGAGGEDASASGAGTGGGNAG